MNGGWNTVASTTLTVVFNVKTEINRLKPDVAHFGFKNTKGKTFLWIKWVLKPEIKCSKPDDAHFIIKNTSVKTFFADLVRKK